MFHNISKSGLEVESVAIRAIASEPTRIECYDSSGSLLFVDAEGNGSFADPGDLVASKNIYGLNPVIGIDNMDTLIEMRYQPIDRENEMKVEVHIETHRMNSNAEWQLDVIDWLERGE